MLDFLPIDLSDKEWMTELFEAGGAPSEEYNFVFAYIWRKTYGLTATRMGDYVLVFSSKPTPSYLFPCGKGPLKPVLDAIIQDAKDRGIQLQLHCLMPEQIEQMEAIYPGKFTYELQRDYADYIYSADKLRTLSGKKLHAKRNHINRFLENNPNWHYEPITQDNIGDCLLMNDGANSQIVMKIRIYRKRHVRCARPLRIMMSLGLTAACSIWGIRSSPIPSVHG
mgnify:CR=1 FL=1